MERKVHLTGTWKLSSDFEGRRIERIRDAIAQIHDKEIADLRCELLELLDEYGGDPLYHYYAALDRGDADHAQAIYSQCVSIGLWRPR